MIGRLPVRTRGIRWRAYAAVVAVAMAGACARQIVLPDGSRAYSRTCADRSRCYQYMGNLCPNGYSIVEESCIGAASIGGAPQVNVNVNSEGTASTGPPISCMKRTMIFRCK